MEKEPKPEEIIEESYRIFRDGFYVSSGTPTAHALFIHFLAWEKGMTPGDALNYYSSLFSELSKNSDFSMRITQDMVEYHSPRSKESIYIETLSNLENSSTELWRGVIHGRIRIEEFYFQQIQAQIPRETSMEVLESQVGSSKIGGMDSLNKILEYIGKKYKDRQVHAALKNVAAYIGLFDHKTWFTSLTEGQKVAYKRRGEKICNEALAGPN